MDSETSPFLTYFVGSHPDLRLRCFLYENTSRIVGGSTSPELEGQHPNNQMGDYDARSRIDRPMKIGSVSGLLVALTSLGIIFLGVREFFYPAIAARQFGAPLLDPRDGDLLAIKAARDVVSGFLALTFLGLGNRRFLTYAFGVLTLIPVSDGLIVLRHAHWSFTRALLIHWGTAAFMLVIVELLRTGK